MKYIILISMFFAAFSVQAQGIVKVSAKKFKTTNQYVYVDDELACANIVAHNKNSAVVAASKAVNGYIYFNTKDCTLAAANSVEADKEKLMRRIKELKIEVAQLQGQVEGGVCSAANVNNSQEIKEIKQELERISRRVATSKQ